MISRVATAAATASVVPFHCVICFEEFNLTDRYPVVLPCGHTYLCNACARRLKRCMECRESLFYVSPAPKVPPINPRSQPYYYRGRVPYNQQSAANNPPPQPAHDPVPLPLPKNLVLISMMEAAERQTELPVPEGGLLDSSTATDDEDEFDLNRIISGMATLSGPCGTYAVRDPEGLTVLPNHPKAHNEEDNGNNLSKDPFHIVKGQTIQVVDFNDGVAKLARGCGYVVATNLQLVKVGGPLETCCRLEGMVDTLNLRGRDLETALNENSQIERTLRTKIELERRKEPNYPVITEPPVSVNSNTNDKFCSSPQTTRNRADMASEPMLRLPGSPDDILLSQNKGSSGLQLVGENRVLVYSSGGRYPPSSPNSIDNSEINRIGPPGAIPHYRRNSEDDLNAFAYGCGSALFGKNFLGFDGNDHRMGMSFDSLEEPPRLSDAVAHANATANVHRTGTGLSHVSHALVAPSTPVLSNNSFETVDFRTGLSGHRALSKTSPRSTPIHRHVRMMGEHRGVSVMRGHGGPGGPVGPVGPGPAGRNGGRGGSNSPSFGPRFASPQDYHLDKKINT